VIVRELLDLLVYYCHRYSPLNIRNFSSNTPVPVFATRGRVLDGSRLCDIRTGPRPSLLQRCSFIVLRPRVIHSEVNMSEGVIQTQVSDRVARLTFNRPDKLNALSRELLGQSIDTLKTWSTDSEVGAIVVTGSGRAFCAGGDVSMMNNEADAALTLEQRIDGLREVQTLSWLLYNSPKVTIAAVNGFAMGAGLGVCLACDLRIASDQARFGTAYAKVGFGGDFGFGFFLLPFFPLRFPSVCSPPSCFCAAPRCRFLRGFAAAISAKPSHAGKPPRAPPASNRSTARRVSPPLATDRVRASKDPWSIA